MDKNPDLSTANREDLLALIAHLRTSIGEQQAVIVHLQQRVAALEERLRRGGGGGMPGTKPAATRRQERKQPRKRRPLPHGFARRRPAPQHVVHAVERCPDCGTRLQGGWVQRTREVVEVPLVPVRWWSTASWPGSAPTAACGMFRRWALGGSVVGKQRLGVGLGSLIVTLRETGRLPIRTIQWWLDTVYQLHLSVGGIVAVLHQTARQAQGAVAAVRERIRASPVVHADETGWREDGVNWLCLDL